MSCVRHVSQVSKLIHQCAKKVVVLQKEDVANKQMIQSKCLNHYAAAPPKLAWHGSNILNPAHVHKAAPARTDSL